MTPETDGVTEVEVVLAAELETPDIDLTRNAEHEVQTEPEVLTEPEVQTEPAVGRSAGNPVARHTWRIASIVFVAVIALVAVAAGLTRTSLFGARTIHVSGAVHLTRSDILRIAQIAPGTNVFTFDAAAAERRLERDPWITQASITKGLPSTLSVVIRERVAVAVVELNSVLRLVADDGSLLDRALPRTAVGLPKIVSTLAGILEPSAGEVRSAALSVAAMVPSLRRDVEAVSILSDGQLRVDLRSGAQVAYGPPVDLVAKAQALRALMAYAAAQGKTVSSADLRVPSAPTAQLAG